MTTLAEYLDDHTPMTVIIKTRGRSGGKVHLPDGGGVEPRCGHVLNGAEWTEKNPAVLFDDVEMCSDCLALVSGGSAPGQAESAPGQTPGPERARELAEKARNDDLHNLAEWLDECARKEEAAREA